MFIHGGTTETGVLLSDMHALDLVKLRWVEIKTTGENLRALSNHAACLVVNKEKLTYQNFNMFKYCDCGLKTEKIKHEGIYIFGGLNEASQFTNDLVIVKINRQELKIHKPRTEGASPSARADCSVNFFEELKYVVVHGGRDSQEFKCDTYILDIVKFVWYRIENILEEDLYNKCRLTRRSGHSNVLYKDNVYIFGGNNDIFVGSELFSLNLSLTKKTDLPLYKSFKYNKSLK
jgi:hypothetical protein